MLTASHVSVDIVPDSATGKGSAILPDSELKIVTDRVMALAQDATQEAPGLDHVKCVMMMWYRHHEMQHCYSRAEALLCDAPPYVH